MITQHGPRCDVCGNYIIAGKSINPFDLHGVVGTLCCHDDCKGVVLEMIAKQDWKLLPEGPLRSFYEENQDKIVTKEPSHA